MAACIGAVTVRCRAVTRWRLQSAQPNFADEFASLCVPIEEPALPRGW